MRHFPYCTN